jgi:AcrR family transcriptional regulator
MNRSPEDRRANQRLRTRKDLLLAAGRLLEEGRTPGMDEIAAAAMVSRATAYRYFPTLEALLLESPLQGETPEPQTLFAGDDPGDAEERIDRAEAALHRMSYANARQLRLMLAHSLAREPADAMPRRQNRRTPLIEAALEPARGQFRPAALKTLGKALALVVGTEAMVVCKDVLQLDESEARKVRRWAIRALVDAARNEAPRAAVPDGRRGGRRG